jgi:hypothetical protein
MLSLCIIEYPDSLTLSSGLLSEVLFKIKFLAFAPTTITSPYVPSWGRCHTYLSYIFNAEIPSLVRIRVEEE